MASLIKKKKANTIYYYVVESARVDGKPRIVHQTYLGTAESVARLVQDRSAPVPLSATTVDFGAARRPVAGGRELRCFADSKTATGWAGDRCITGRTRRRVSMPSAACSASRCCNAYAGRRRRHGPDSPPKNFWTSCARSRNTLCYTRPKAARGQTESPRCCPSNRLRNRDWPGNSVSISSVVPNVGNTTTAE